MAKVVVGFSNSVGGIKGLFCYLIRWFESPSWFTIAECSHAYMRFYAASFNRDVIYEASQFNTHFVGTKMFSKRKHIVDEIQIDVDESDYQEAVSRMIDFANYPYGILQIVGMAIDRILVKCGIRLLRIPFSDGETTQVCSETIARLLESAGIEICGDLDRIGPNELRASVSRIGRKL